jgi:hypothetical protein
VSRHGIFISKATSFKPIKESTKQLSHLSHSAFLKNCDDVMMIRNTALVNYEPDRKRPRFVIKEQL